ncbi:MAG TPA: PilZ domain-containing protein [Bryobacteraceae bacterium]|nr:PilZ domain-containing protein [Bryobacteraceae bacterium]
MTTKNHRRHRRIPYTGPIRFSWEEQGTPRFGAGRCIDLSEDGLRIETTQSVRPGSPLQFCAERINLSGSATVKRMERSGGKYLLGVHLPQSALAKTVASLEGIDTVTRP